MRFIQVGNHTINIDHIVDVVKDALLSSGKKGVCVITDAPDHYAYNDGSSAPYMYRVELTGDDADDFLRTFEVSIYG